MINSLCSTREDRFFIKRTAGALLLCDLCITVSHLTLLIFGHYLANHARGIHGIYNLNGIPRRGVCRFFLKVLWEGDRHV